MTKRERHEIAVVTRLFVNDENDEIRKAYEALYDKLAGIRAYIRKELIEFWSCGEPYLETEYLDYEWMKIGSHIINLDDAWVWIRDGLKSECMKKAA